MTAQDFLCKAKVGVTNDLSGRQKLRIAAGVIAVRMRVDDVPDGLVGQRLYFGNNIVVITFELIVDKNDTFVREQYGRIAPLAQNDIEIVLEPLELRRRRRLGI